MLGGELAAAPGQRRAAPRLSEMRAELPMELMPEQGSLSPECERLFVRRSDSTRSTEPPELAAHPPRSLTGEDPLQNWVKSDYWSELDRQLMTTSLVHPVAPVRQTLLDFWILRCS